LILSGKWNWYGQEQGFSDKRKIDETRIHRDEIQGLEPRPFSARGLLQTAHLFHHRLSLMKRKN
jgi:hypothetical protein